MDFSWSEKELTYKKEIITFAQEKLSNKAIEADRNAQFPFDDWQKCAEFGIQGLAATTAYGGKEEKLDILSAILAMEGFGYGCEDNGLAFALNAQMWTVQVPILQFGTEAQKQKFLPKMVKGEWIAAHALTEPEIGSDVFNMKMTATKCDGGYILNGQKRLVSLAPIADVALVFANTNPKYGKWGVTAFLVEKGMKGFSASPNREKMGLRSVPWGELNFDNCFVPTENRLGKEGAGFSISNHSLEYERCAILGSQVGRMEKQLEVSVEYAKNRTQFGQPIGKFQSVSNRIADMKLRIETAKLLLYKVAWLKKMGKPAMMEAAILKLYISEVFINSSLDAIRVHGGNGYLTNFGVERDLRDSVGGVLYAGTSDIQRNIISQLLGL